MKFIQQLAASILNYRDRIAFHINGVDYTYAQFLYKIEGIRGSIRSQIPDDEKLIGLVTHDDLESYAAILALWFEAKAYVPVNPKNPAERNLQVFRQTDTSFVLDSKPDGSLNQFELINTAELGDESDLSVLKPVEDPSKDLAYILFTSGTTGLPKGVPITYSNMQGLVDAIDADEPFNLAPDDRCLQMFELTFDFSVVAYLFPLLAGAGIYTIPQDAIKYLYIFKLIKEQRLSVLTMVPSIINYLRPYFGEINAPSVRYCSFGGGALHFDLAKEWSNCLPNCQIFNYYGPTEFTVYSGYYPYHKETANKSYNGIISTGSPLKNVHYLVADENNKEVSDGITGELCLGGIQLTPGYWKNPERNKKVFFNYEKNGEIIKYYRTGDLCFKDEAGDFMYVGRADFQVKIRGYRVELAEIEYHVKNVMKQKVNVVAIDVLNRLENAELALAFESNNFEIDYIMDYLKEQMPPYMIPSHIEFIAEFPHSLNGKIDRKKLRTYFKL
ncbi:AMP-binding protein [Spongiivirga citrea]|uniref:AMP-binding protein n=1 Tax=Spongiivirga citrea TaxID=1481457 RepID=A0A6M0CGD2_9FLAO|nr:AMP-binding protein [Spongiivirga citrea]NER16881.1 AMP-binding protein [Spongiivirga citrea]